MVEVSRRSFLQGLGVGILPLKALARPLPASNALRMSIPLLTEHPLRPTHLADAFAQMEILNNRVGIVFMSPKRVLELQSFKLPASFAVNCWDAELDSVKPLFVWGAELVEVDLPDNLLVLEAAPNGAPVDRSDFLIRPIDLGPRLI